MALLNTYQDAEFAVSLRRLFSSYYGPLVRVVRESDLVEVDVLPDSNGEISYDSSISRPEGTLAYTLGQFLNIDGYTDADSLGSVYEGRLITIYDQSVGANHVSYDTFSNAFLFVEHSLPAIFPNSTGIIKVSGVPSFFAVGTSKTFTPYTLLGTEYSLHFLSGQIGSNPIGFRVQGIDTNGLFTSPYDVLLYTNLATTVFQPSGSTNVFDVNNVYINTEQCTETQNNVFAKPTGQSEDTVINSIEFAFFDNATTQANFSAAVDGPSFYIVANSFYADIIVYEGYDNIRRLFIEDLYSNAVNNVETKIALSTFSFEEENVQDNSFIAQFGTPAAAYSVRSLRGFTGVNGPKILRVRRAVDNIEVDVYTDNSGWVSLDSPIENVYETTINTVNREYVSLATTLGEFVADPSYNNPDNITTTTATVSAWYDQSKVNTDLLPLQVTNDEAAAAYSVRLINPEYTGPLLKVRRSSDDVTKDIYPNNNGELDVDAIEQFIQDGVMGPDYTEEYLLDIIPDGETEAPQAAAAYSLRKLKASYTGPLVRVRRQDGIEVDVYPQADGWFGLDSGVTDVVELGGIEQGDSDAFLFRDFARGSDVTVCVWYNQANDFDTDWTYNTNNLQVNAYNNIGGQQPKIYDATTGLILENGRPILESSLGNTLVLPINTSSDYEVFTVINVDSSAGALFGSESNQDYAFLFQDGSTDDRVTNNATWSSAYRNGTGYTIPTGSGARDQLHTDAFGRNLWYLDLTLSFVGSDMRLSYSSPSSFEMINSQELVIYASDPTTDRPTIEKNINNSFHIYGGWGATVETWYDQSGNGNDASQSDTNAQPAIASGGVVIRENGKPAIQTDGSDDTMSLASTISFTDLTWFTVTKKANTDGKGSIIFFGGGTNAYAGDDVDNGGNPFLQAPSATIIRNTLGNNSASGGEVNQHLAYYNRNGTNASGGLNGEVNTEATVATTTFGLTELFQYGNNYNYEGLVQELVLYNSSKKSDRPLIEKSINSYYNIYAQDAAIQNVSTAQPKIYDSSTGVVTENGKPAIYFGDTIYLVNSMSVVNQPLTILNVAAIKSYNAVNYLFDSDPTNTNRIFIGTNTSRNWRYYAGTVINTTSSAPLSQSLLTGIFSGASSKLFVDNLLIDASNAGSNGISDLHIGSKNNGFISARANIQEFVVYSSDQDAAGNRIDIENNINSAFQIYSANFSSVLDTVPLAKAAYSIRRLTKNYIDPIITVTNGSTTKDFYADFWGNLDVDALTSFANGGTLSVTKWWDQSGEGVHLLTTADKPTLAISSNEVSVNTTNKFYEPLLDRYDGAAAAYSLRILKGDYTGPLVRVRRDGTNTEVDVYPDENLTISLNSPVLNVAESTTDVTASPQGTLATTLGEFVADAGSDPDGLGAPVNAFVVVWYDQANSNNASQDISTAQPRIYRYTTNLLLQSNQFDTTWVSNTADVTSGQSGYDSTNDAWLLNSTDSTGTGFPRIEQTISASGISTLSVYAKAATDGFMLIRTFGADATVWFDLNSGNIVGSSGAQYVSSKTDNVGNGWYRCSVVLNGSLTSVRFYPASAFGVYSTSGNGIYIQDAQLGTGYSVTDYIETTTSAVTVSGVVTENGKPALYFNGAEFIDVPPIGMTIATLFAVHDNGGSTSQMLGMFDRNDNSFFYDLGTYMQFRPRGGTISTTPTAQIDFKSWYLLVNAASSEAAVNNQTPDAGATNAVALARVRIGLRSSTYFTGHFYEMVLYASNESSNRAGVNANINNHYQIPSFNATVSTAQTVAVYNNAINTTVDLNATYTDLKEIIKYE